ncbi:hypothetical protein Leryth_014531 [Lithospermum erythrorhizon]|uniref:Protein DCL, chloroplastic n=1 Tax=Lithospermum erythrorhizon TaxID=34254 RepID=A0AAV3PER1_LITER|nr:hypothetical protein Leryth_014531 [Lithospermum erythrorhizon]
MALNIALNCLQIHLDHTNPIFLSPPLVSLSFSLRLRRCCLAVKTSSAAATEGGELLRKPEVAKVVEEEEEGEVDEKLKLGGRWVDWEDQILEDTVPLVGFVRMILHSGKYKSGDRLTPEHERTILERLLPHHPDWKNKIGGGVDYITVGYHPDFEGSRCLFIVQKDGALIDFSYWKCIKGLIKKKYPLYADSFILKHFRRRRTMG